MMLTCHNLQLLNVVQWQPRLAFMSLLLLTGPWWWLRQCRPRPGPVPRCLPSPASVWSMYFDPGPETGGGREQLDKGNFHWSTWWHLRDSLLKGTQLCKNKTTRNNQRVLFFQRTLQLFLFINKECVSFFGKLCKACWFCRENVGI